MNCCGESVKPNCWQWTGILSRESNIMLVASYYEKRSYPLSSNRDGSWLRWSVGLVENLSSPSLRFSRTQCLARLRYRLPSVSPRSCRRYTLNTLWNVIRTIYIFCWSRSSKKLIKLAEVIIRARQVNSFVLLDGEGQRRRGGGSREWGMNSN